jgi:hypothetical protein
LSPASQICSVSFDAEAFVWRGPAPFLFAQVPEAFTGELRYAASLASYGWGVIPVEVKIGDFAFATSLFPREGSYLLPLKLAVQRTLGIGPGDRIEATLIVKAR